MESCVINTTEANTYWQDAYCSTCGSCGDLWCECWAGCSLMRCKYGPEIISQCENDRANSSLWFDMLIILGIENPFEIDLERIKLISEIDIVTTCDMSIGELVNFYFNQLKDMEDE